LATKSIHRAKRLPTYHEFPLLLALITGLDLAYGRDKSVLGSLCDVSKLVKVVAHLLLVIQLHRHHSRFEILLLLIGTGLAGFARFFEKC